MENLFGRRKIFINKNLPTNVNELIKSLEKPFQTHLQNKKEIEYLHKYLRGNQDILYRDNKKIRPEIDNKVTVNQAKHIIDFKKGYLFSEPIQFIKNSNKSHLTDVKTTEDGKDDQVLLINEYAQEAGKLSVDKEAGFWTLIGGIGYVSCLPNKDDTSKIPFNLYSLDPTTTFVCYSADFRKEPILAVTYFEDVVDEQTTNYNMTIYTKDKAYEAVIDNKFEIITQVKETVSILGEIPIVEFNLNETRQGAFEPVLPLLNLLNKLTSDRVNDVEQAVQWFMKFINCEIDSKTYDEFRRKGLIMAKSEPGNPADIDILSTTLDQTQIQVFSDFVYQQILEITNVPDRNASAGGNTGNALVIGQGWAGAETDARASETLLEKSQRMVLKLMLNICKKSLKADILLKDVFIEEISIKFTRNKTDNLLVKTQALSQLLSAGVAPLLAFELCGLFSDPQKAYEMSKETLEKYKYGGNQDVKKDPRDDITDPKQKIASVY